MDDAEAGAVRDFAVACSEARAVPIDRLLKDSSLEPREVACLSEAYQAALRALLLVDRNDAITEIVARKIIDLYQSGIRDPAQIVARAVKELGGP
jgi:hypothetical protein